MMTRSTRIVVTQMERREGGSGVAGENSSQVESVRLGAWFVSEWSRGVMENDTFCGHSKESHGGTSINTIQWAVR